MGARGQRRAISRSSAALDRRARRSSRQRGSLPSSWSCRHLPAAASCRTSSSSSPCSRSPNTGTSSPATPGSSRSASRPSSASAPTRSSPRRSFSASIRCSPSSSAASSPRLLALPTALIVFRLRGAYFAIGTWVAAEVFRLILAQVKQLGGGTGTSLGPDDHQRHGRPRRWIAATLRRAHFRRTRHRRLLAGARCSSSGRWRWSISCSARGAAWRSPRSATSEAAAVSLGVDSFRTQALRLRA